MGTNTAVTIGMVFICIWTVPSFCDPTEIPPSIRDTTHPTFNTLMSPAVTVDYLTTPSSLLTLLSEPSSTVNPETSIYKGFLTLRPENHLFPVYRAKVRKTEHKSTNTSLSNGSTLPKPVFSHDMGPTVPSGSNRELYKLFMSKLAPGTKTDRVNMSVKLPIFSQPVQKPETKLEASLHSEPVSKPRHQNVLKMNPGESKSETDKRKDNKTSHMFTKLELESEMTDLLRLDRQGLERLLSSLVVGFLDVLTAPVSELRQVDAKVLIRRTITKALGEEVLPKLKPDYRNVLSRLLEMGEDSSLPLASIKSLQELGGNGTACLQRLICRTSPFVWGLQQSLSQSNRLLTRDENRCQSARPGWWPVYLPTKGALGDFSQSCDQRFPHCQP